MFGSEALDVGVGMCLLFLFMSLIASALRELIETYRKSRARDLERGIRELLGDGKPCGITAAQFYDHPLISSLYAGDYAPASRTLPSYIPRRHFSLAVVDIAAGTASGGEMPTASALRARLQQQTAPTALQRIVLSTMSETGEDLDRIRRAIELWYDASMDRVSGWYTRRTKHVLGFLGLGAAIAFNVDAFTVAQRLITDKALRQVVMSEAGRVVPSDGELRAGTKSVAEAISAIGYPVGWTFTSGRLYPAPQACHYMVQQEAPDCAWRWEMIRIPFGWMITALAIMLGAPFWFDVLNRFMVVRSTVKPRDKDEDDPSLDPKLRA